MQGESPAMMISQANGLGLRSKPMFLRRGQIQNPWQVAIPTLWLPRRGETDGAGEAGDVVVFEVPVVDVNLQPVVVQDAEAPERV